MLTTLLMIFAGIVTAVALLGGAFVAGMRAKSPLVHRFVVWLGTWFLNAKQLKVAGRSGTSTSIVRHRGRRTGRSLETPVDVVPDGDAFLVALPYGRSTQWLRNVLAAGGGPVCTSAIDVHPLVAYTVIPR